MVIYSFYSVWQSNGSDISLAEESPLAYGSSLFVYLSVLVSCIKQESIAVFVETAVDVAVFLVVIADVDIQQ